MASASGFGGNVRLRTDKMGSPAHTSRNFAADLVGHLVRARKKLAKILMGGSSDSSEEAMIYWTRPYVKNHLRLLPSLQRSGLVAVSLGGASPVHSDTLEVSLPKERARLGVAKSLHLALRPFYSWATRQPSRMIGDSAQSQRLAAGGNTWFCRRGRAQGLREERSARTNERRRAGRGRRNRVPGKTKEGRLKPYRRTAGRAEDGVTVSDTRRIPREPKRARGDLRL